MKYSMLLGLMMLCACSKPAAPELLIVSTRCPRVVAQVDLPPECHDLLAAYPKDEQGQTVITGRAGALAIKDRERVIACLIAEAEQLWDHAQRQDRIILDHCQGGPVTSDRPGGGVGSGDGGGVDR